MRPKSTDRHAAGSAASSLSEISAKHLAERGSPLVLSSHPLQLGHESVAEDVGHRGAPLLRDRAVVRVPSTRGTPLGRQRPSRREGGGGRRRPTSPGGLKMRSA
eukprot:scaffold81933_cov28-Tisochrysis_lutea.AAC.9